MPPPSAVQSAAGILAMWSYLSAAGGAVDEGVAVCCKALAPGGKSRRVTVMGRRLRLRAPRWRHRLVLREAVVADRLRLEFRREYDAD